MNDANLYRAATRKWLPPRAVIFGCAGPVLLPEERVLFHQADPFGFILFGRNCESPEQISQLVDHLHATVGRSDVPIFIDQEGGRVARLGPPHWVTPPTARSIGDLWARKPDLGQEAAWLNGRLIAADLRRLGITVNCAPVADVAAAGSGECIGDRAYGETVQVVTACARAVADGLLAGGVLPVVKHLPGHGRTVPDPHESLPTVDASLDDLLAQDFAAFHTLRELPLGMVAHVVYSAIDAAHPASQSAKVIDQIIRKEIGFGGLLIADDVVMGALSGDMVTRARACWEAGNDVILHCNGDFQQMVDLSIAAPLMSPESQERWAFAQDRVNQAQNIGAPSANIAQMSERLDTLLGHLAAHGNP